MLHLLYPPRKPETPPSPRAVYKVLLVSCCHEGSRKFPRGWPALFTIQTSSHNLNWMCRGNPRLGSSLLKLVGLEFPA